MAAPCCVTLIFAPIFRFRSSRLFCFHLLAFFLSFCLSVLSSRRVFSFSRPSSSSYFLKISKSGNAPLLYDDIPGQSLHLQWQCFDIPGQRLNLQHQCKMPAWLSQRYATLFVCHTPSVTNVYLFFPRATSRVTRASHIAGTVSPLSISQHCGYSSSHPPSILLIFVHFRSFFSWARSYESAFELLVLRNVLAFDFSACRPAVSLAMRSAGSSPLLRGCHRLYPASRTVTVWLG
jgi:hypothetical protein